MKWIKVAVHDTFDPTADRIILDTPVAETECNIWQPTYRNILDHGFIGLVDHMGDDQTIVDSARVSYGGGTKRVSEDRNLIRYLMRHHHYSPIEMVETRWHIKMPIFVMRQLIRHRAAACNEVSGRYSILPDELYMPEIDVLKPQSSTNKQGRDGALNQANAHACQLQLQHAYQDATQAYRYLLGKAKIPSLSLNQRRMLIEEFAVERIKWLKNHDAEWQTDVSEEKVEEKIAEIFNASGIVLTDQEFWGDTGSGLARELARIVLPLASYTEFYWKIDLRNLFNFIGLRSDPHAQYEIQVYANAMLEMIDSFVPICVEAFIDYQKQARQFSRMEMAALRELYKNYGNPTTITDILRSEGASKREINEFIETLSK